MRRVVDNGEGKAEERAHSSEASADSFCKVMGLLGMGHRLFVPKLLAVRKRGPGNRCWMKKLSMLGWSGVELEREWLLAWLVLVKKRPTNEATGSAKSRQTCLQFL